MTALGPSEIQAQFGHCPHPWLAAKLFGAAEAADLPAMRSALSGGADPLWLDRCRAGLAQAAARSGSPQALKIALDAGASPNAAPDSERPCPLRALAAQCGRAPWSNEPATERAGLLAMAKMLLAQGAEPNGLLGSYWEDNPLATACSRDALELSRLLLTRGADPLLRFRQNMDALLVACEHGSSRCAELILDWFEIHGIPFDPHALGEGGESALHKAVASGASPALIQRLVGLGCPLDALNQSGMSPLHEAACRGFDQAIELLLGAGAQVDLVGRDGRSALRFAADQGHPGSCFVLARHGADPDAIQALGLSARQAAIETSCLGAIEAGIQARELQALSPAAAPSARKLAL